MEKIEKHYNIAIALNGLGMIDPSIDFSGVAKKVMKANALRDVADRFNIKSKVTDAKTAFREFGNKIKINVSTPKRARGRNNVSPFASIIEKVKNILGIKDRGKGKVRVAYDADVRDQGDYGIGAFDENVPQGPSPLDSWIGRIAVLCLSIFLIYFGVAAYTTSSLEKKIEEADNVIYKVEAEVKKADSDAEYIRKQASEYSTKISKLQDVMKVIETEKRKSNFDIPNFMSQVMFIIPQGVSITNINIDDMGEVSIYAVSPQYAQLGYFVSKLKLEKVLLDVDMEVLEMDQSIKIKVGGMLP